MHSPEHAGELGAKLLLLGEPPDAGLAASCRRSTEVSEVESGQRKILVDGRATVRGQRCADVGNRQSMIRWTAPGVGRSKTSGTAPLSAITVLPSQVV